LGSVTELTDSSQTVVESYKYDAFGKLETPPATGNPYTYTSREYDPETGLYFYRARYYDPTIGRFITADPIGFGGGVNFYAYGQNNPVNLVDPNGKIGVETIVIIISIISALLALKSAADCIHAFTQATACCEEIPQPRPSTCPDFEEDIVYLEKLAMWRNRCFNYCEQKYRE